MKTLSTIATTMLLLASAGAAHAGPDGARPRPGEDSFVGPLPASIEPKTPAKSEVKPEVKPDIKPEAKPEPKLQPKTEPKSEPKSEPRSEPKSEPKAEPRAESALERRVAGAAEPRPEAPAEPAVERPASRKELAREESAPLGKPAVKEAAKPAASEGVGMTRTVLALSAVLALIVLAAGVFKKIAARSGGLAGAMGAGGKAPSGILSILGRYPLDRTTTLVLLKVDRRVLLLSQTRGGARLAGATLTTLCEITGADEVASIMAKSSAADGASPAVKFQRALEEETDDVEDEEPKATPDGAALAAVIQAALKHGRQAVAPKPAPVRAAPAVDAAAELRKKLAAMRAKAAVQIDARAKTEVVA